MQNLYQRAGITKAELARRLKMNPNTVYKWKYLPGYAEAYLELLIELQALDDIKKAVQKWNHLRK